MDEYTPTPAEQALARHIDTLVDAMLSGKLSGVAVCAVDHSGIPAFFYLNKPDEPVLRSALSKLTGLYEVNQRFKSEMNAPKNNRSYLAH